LEYFDEVADQGQKASHGSFLSLSQHCFEFGKALLDLIEVRAVWRREPECRACGLDLFGH
jgi:hypothetical protein